MEEAERGHLRIRIERRGVRRYACSGCCRRTGRVRDRNAITMPAAVLECVASVDGAVVLKSDGELVAVGALLRMSGGIRGAEGARTTAAISASAMATVLKVSEDGGISLVCHGRLIWEL